ncbi:cytidylate kinase-like family protein [Streptomyces sp. NBC_01244]|uniref:cytidylate kinase-like family protein n=1 Tax=Streptomyces sp. NBC_01244 TaxID=2903797 RepID=UPI002E152516|nr:cytidylate kinase family protein [Streptomyces sp. NBC_01244]
MTQKIVISGLTAAGKTTHAKLLAETLGFRAVHFTDLLLQELQVEAGSADQVWFSRLHEIESMRAGGSADRRVDETIGELLAADEPMVVDAVLAPWLHPGRQINVWLGSDRASRAWKCSVSRLPGVISTDDSLRLLDKKDAFTRAYLWQERAVDLYTDRSCFDLVLDNSHLIGEPTAAAARKGIRQLHQVLLAYVNWRLERQDNALLELAETTSPGSAAIVHMDVDHLTPSRTILASRQI